MRVIMSVSLRGIIGIRKVETALANNPFLAGNDFTAADVMMGFTLGSAKWLNILTEDYPRTMAYVDRLFARPGLQQALT